MSDMKPMRVLFGETLCELGNEYSNLVVLDADVSSSTQTKLFAGKYPDRFYNFGIAEANMVSAAAGMAVSGLIPVVSSFAFLLSLRCGDAVRSLVAYNKLNVKMAGGYGGLSDYADGASHQSICDIGIMHAIPNITVIVPSDITETKMAVRAMLEYDGPVYLRLSREGVTQDYASNHPFEIGKGIMLRDGEDLTIIATGMTVPMAREAAEELEKKGISARLIDMHTTKPLDVEIVRRAAQETGVIVTAEEHNIFGGLGSSVCAAVCENHPVPVYRCGLRDCFGESGPYQEILERAGIDVKTIVSLSKKAIAAKIS
ncbi:MAG TPA: transketolase C-terminal domain-containing protein [Desulfatiglandales bacterium]|nr:transketolase C-terminal domain-containing protein [Desulfatiglandales bacterium]